MHISSPVSESWVNWILLLFFILLVVNRSVRESVVVALRNSFSHSERVYGGQSQNILAISTAWIFRVGVLAMVIYLLLHVTECFTFVGYIAAIIPALILPYYSVIGGWVIKYFFPFNEAISSFALSTPMRKQISPSK